jgi:hypothetical protein
MPSWKGSAYSLCASEASLRQLGFSNTFYAPIEMPHVWMGDAGRFSQ